MRVRVRVPAFWRRYALWHHLWDVWRACGRYWTEDALLRDSRLNTYQRLLGK